ncbi:MAG: ABC transporter ATP-binding protein [Candidatus Omnitrophica bacterium]|nr:ABC transporter ATP-binding protein [Candidatus Omnitrophota bacterium]
MSGKSGSVFLRLLRALMPHRRYMLTASSALVLSTGLQLVGPYLIKVGIDGFMLTRDAGGLLKIGVWYLAVQLGLMLFSYLEINAVALAAQGLMRDFRKAAYDHLSRLHTAFFDRTPAGKLITNVTHDVESLNELISSGLVTILGDLFILAGITAVMFWMDAGLAVLAVSLTPLVILMTRFFAKRLRAAYLMIRHQVALLTIYIQERVAGMRIVQVFNRERDTLAQHHRLNLDHHNANVASIRLHAIFNPLIAFLSTVTVAVILWVGSLKVISGELTLGSLVAFLVYVEMYFKPIGDLSEKFNILQGAAASCEKIFDLLDEPPGILDPPVAAAPAEPLTVDFERVDFAYDGHAVLSDVSFSVRPGEMIAVVGPTGAGKTTLVNLLLRLYDVKGGAVRVGGADVRHLKQHDLRSLFGIVSQNVFLFSGSLWENVTLGDDSLDLAYVRSCLESVGARAFVERLAGGSGEEELPEEAKTLSAGERQLLSVARALAHEPRILILDEATALIDSETERKVQETLKALRGKVTQIVIAHRLSTIEEADRILVINEGRLIETGTHEELMRRRGMYWGFTQRIGTRMA